MSTRTTFALLLGAFCSCSSVARATRLELVDSDGSIVAELSRTEGRTSLRFYEYPAGNKCTTVELESRTIDVTHGEHGELEKLIKQLGYEIPTATSRITFAAKNGLRSELSNDGVVFYDEDGAVLWVVSVTNPPEGTPILELFDGDGKTVLSTARAE